MLTILIGLLALFLIYMSVSSGEWICLAVVVVGTLLLIAMAACDRKTTKAVNNMIDYWAEDEPRRK